MFKKLFAAVGVGNARVDTRLSTTALHPGQPFEGKVFIQGGAVAQYIDAIDIKLWTRAKSNSDQGGSNDICLAAWRIDANFEVQPKEQREIPFRLQLHSEAPFTRLPTRKNQSRVWLTTGLDIDMAVDPTDHDNLDIQSTQVLTHILATMDRLGFDFKKADVEQGYLSSSAFRSQSGCYQELEFLPRRSSEFFLLNEIELSLVCEEHRTHVFVELNN